MFKIGDKVFFIPALDTVEDWPIRTVTRVSIQNGEEIVEMNGDREYVSYSCYVWPERVKSMMTELVRERERLKKEFDSSMQLVYRVRNQLTKGEL